MHITMSDRSEGECRNRKRLLMWLIHHRQRWRRRRILQFRVREPTSEGRSNREGPRESLLSDTRRRTTEAGRN